MNSKPWFAIALVCLVACKSDKNKEGAGYGNTAGSAPKPTIHITATTSTPDANTSAPVAIADASAAVAKAAEVALPFCKKPIGKLAEADMPTFSQLVASLRSPRPADPEKLGDKLLPFAARTAFLEDDQGRVTLLVSPSDEDPCKQEWGAVLTEKRRPMVRLEVNEPGVNTFVHPYNDVMTAATHKQVVGSHGWALEAKNAGGEDSASDFLRGAQMLKVTRYEKGKVLEGELIACADEYQYEPDSKDIKAFVIGPVRAAKCPE